MSKGLATVVLFLATVVAWVGLELFYILTGQPTISAQVAGFFASYPPFGVLVALVTGLLLAHFFWPAGADKR